MEIDKLDPDTSANFGGCGHIDELADGEMQIHTHMHTIIQMVLKGL